MPKRNNRMKHKEVEFVLVGQKELANKTRNMLTKSR